MLLYVAHISRAYAQAVRCFEVITAALAEAGAELRHVVRTRMFVTDIDRRTVEARVSADLPRAILTIGAAYDRSEGATDYRSESAFGPFDASARFDRANRGLFAQLLADPVDRLDLTLGARLDHNDAFGTFETWRAGASFRLLDHTRLRGGFGIGFREPTFGETYGSGFGDRGNPDLHPERSRSAELGLEHQLAGGHVRIAATAFHQRFEDLIQYTFTAPGEINYFNVGAARSAGFELTAEANRGRLSLAAGYTHVATRVLDPGLATDASFVEGQPLLRRPAHSGSLATRWRLDRGVIGLTLGLVGEREDVDYSADFPYPRVSLPPFATLDLAAEHDLPGRAGDLARVLFRAENLADAAYETVHGFPAPGRLVHVGVRIVAGGK